VALAASGTLAAGCLLSACGASTAPHRNGGEAVMETTSTAVAPIPRELRAEARSIGRGARFHPALRNRPVRECRRELGRRIEAHVELFAQNRVVLLPAGIGTRPPRKLEDGRVKAARCYGPVSTLEPTGIVFVRRGSRARIASLFAAWGEPLSETRIASFAAPAGTRVAAFVDGRRRRGSPRKIPLTEHAEIVLEVGPHVPPHRSFAFPPGR
jgi:hypothetical protein